jgi:hypothetical protein
MKVSDFNRVQLCPRISIIQDGQFVILQGFPEDTVRLTMHVNGIVYHIHDVSIHGPIQSTRRIPLPRRVGEEISVNLRVERSDGSMLMTKFTTVPLAG